jgi:hypothetical protein
MLVLKFGLVERMPVECLQEEPIDIFRGAELVISVYIGVYAMLEAVAVGTEY